MDILVMFVIAVFVAGCVGIIKAFMRNAVVAVLLLIFLFPVLWLWGFVELFTGDLNPNKNKE